MLFRIKYNGAHSIFNIILLNLHCAYYTAQQLLTEKPIEAENFLSQLLNMHNK